MWAEDHAAISIRETKEGLEVWAQFNEPRKTWGKRIRCFSKDKDRSNDGNRFHVIDH